MIIPFGEWLPDRADLGNAATVALNCVPKAGGSYGPFSDIAAFSDALSARCQGAYAGADKDAAVGNFAGDASKLYKLSGTTFNDVSRTAGYTTASDEAWHFCQYGNRVIATNFADPVQSYVLGGSTLFSDLSSDAPKARHCALIDPGFLMLGNTSDNVDGAAPNRVWWSAYADPTRFPTIGSAAAEAAQSDFNDLPYGGWVNAVVGAVGGASGLVFCDTAIYRLDYAGPPVVFQFTCIERQRGTPAPNSVVNIGPFAAFLGPDGFYLNDGQQSRPIGAGKIDKTFYSDLNQNYFDRIYGAVDPINKLIIWVYPSTASQNGLCDSALIYAWEADQWAKASISCEIVFRALASSLTLENLDNVAASLDVLPFSLDSRAWTGGQILLAAFDSDHKYALFNGDSLEATIETGESESDGRFIYVKGARPLIDGGTPSLSIGYRNNQNATINYTPDSTAGDDGICYQHVSARYVRARVTVPSGSSWTHASGVQPDYMTEGGR